MLGAEKVAKVACWVMALPQVAVIGLLTLWDKPFHALAVGTLLVIQISAMGVLLRDPEGKTLGNRAWVFCFTSAA